MLWGRKAAAEASFENIGSKNCFIAAGTTRDGRTEVEFAPTHEYDFTGASDRGRLSGEKNNICLLAW